MTEDIRAVALRRRLFWLAAAAPDALFVDIGLPKPDGYEVARRLRREAVLAACAATRR